MARKIFKALRRLLLVQAQVVTDGHLMRTRALNPTQRLSV